MKKLFCFMLSIFLVLCIGCETIDNTSSLLSDINTVVDNEILKTPSDTESTESATDNTSSESSQSQPSSNPTPSSQTAPTVTESTPSTTTVVVDKEIKDDEVAVIKPAPVVIKGDKPMSFSYLTEEQQRLYRILKTAISDMTEMSVDLQVEKSKGDVTKIKNDINVAFRAVSFDNPEFFWIPTGYVMLQSGEKRYVAFKYADDKNDINYYPIKKSDRDTMKKQLDQKVNELLSKVKDKDSFETEVYLHDYLCENIVYTLTEKDDMIYTAYGALVNGKAVCEGYSRAMQLLCDKLEIPCGLVYGWSQGIGHMWNLINPGDGWYHLDVTWDDDDDNGIISHRYLNTTRYSMTHNDGHIIAEEYKKDTLYEDLDVYNFLNTECSNTALNYFERRGYVINKCDESEKPLINNLASGGAKFFEVKNNSIETMQSVVSFIAGTLSKPVSYYESYDIVTIVLQ